MLLLAKFIGKILSILNSEESPNQLAAGFAIGAWIGLIPIKGLFPTLFLFLSFMINVNLAMLAVGTGLFKLLAFAIDPLANAIGFHLLTKVPGLHPFWTGLYNMPVVPYTRFNNTIVLGSFLIGLAALAPLFFLAKMGIRLYRSKVRDKILKFKLMKLIQASTFYKYYLSYKGISGE